MPITLILVRKLLRDVRWPLLVVCLLLFLFSLLWVRIAWRVTTEIAPYFNVIGALAGNTQQDMEDVVFTGVGKVSQAVLGGSDVNFQQPTDFLAVEMLHPVVLVLAMLWSVGRAAGAVSGELGGGTMELLLSQPVPRNRLIFAHLIVDAVTIPLILLSVSAGTHLGLSTTGEFRVNAAAVDKLVAKAPLFAQARVRALVTEQQVLPVSAAGQWKGLANLGAVMFAMSGVSVLVSACGRNRWRTCGWAALIVLGMYVVNVVAQLWEPLAVVRPFTLFFYYQPQKVWLRDEWFADVGEAWTGGRPLFKLPVVAVLMAVGAAGYAVALRVFTRRDLPAPL